MQLVSAGLYAFGAVVLGTALLGSRASGPIPKNTPLAFRVAANLRTPVLMFVVIPLSYVRAWQRTLRMWWRAYVRRGEDNEKAHAANVQNLVRQIKAWNEAGRPGMLRTARPSWNLNRLEQGRRAQAGGAPHEPDPARRRGEPDGHG